MTAFLSRGAKPSQAKPYTICIAPMQLHWQLCIARTMLENPLGSCCWLVEPLRPAQRLNVLPGCQLPRSTAFSSRLPRARTALMTQSRFS